MNFLPNMKNVLNMRGGGNAGQEGEDTKDGLGLGGEEEEKGSSGLL